MFGVYLIALSAYQFVVYGWFSQMTGLNPRVGISMVVEGMLQRPHQATEAIEWVSALWLFAVGVLFLCGKNVFKTYIVSEIFFAIPTIFAAAPFLPSLLFGSFGWFIGMVTVFVVFTAVPVGIAIFLCRGASQAQLR